MELRLKKNLKVYLMVLVMILLTTSLVSATGLQGTVVASEGIVRSTMDLKGDVVNKLPIGTRVTILEGKGRWLRIKAQEVEGWMYRDLVALDKYADERTGVIIANVLNVRSEASTNSQVVTRLSEGTEVTIIASQGDWLQIQLEDKTAWVHGDYVKQVPNLPKGVILKNDAPLKEGSSDDSKTLATYKKNDTLYIKGYQNGWFQVTSENFSDGWIKAEYLELKINVTTTVTRSGERSSVFENIADVTSKYLGKKYGWGQTGPNRFDCSGFTYYIYNTYYGDYLKAKGISLPRTSSDQGTIGVTVSRNDLNPGDLVFFNTDSRRNNTITHVGIYIGNGEFIHASSARSVVMISSLSEGYYNTRFIKAVRL